MGSLLLKHLRPNRKGTQNCAFALLLSDQLHHIAVLLLGLGSLGWACPFGTALRSAMDLCVPSHALGGLAGIGTGYGDGLAVAFSVFKLLQIIYGFLMNPLEP